MSRGKPLRIVNIYSYRSTSAFRASSIAFAATVREDTSIASHIPTPIQPLNMSHIEYSNTRKANYLRTAVGHPKRL
jgi:hypothetical protein